MGKDLDLSVLDEIDPEVEAHLPPRWKRILAALRRGRDRSSSKRS